MKKVNFVNILSELIQELPYQHFTKGVIWEKQTTTGFTAFLPQKIKLLKFTIFVKNCINRPVFY